MTPRVFGIDLSCTIVWHWRNTLPPGHCQAVLMLHSYRHFLNLRGNGPPPLCDVLPFEINIENYCLFIGFICTIFNKFLHSSVGWRVREQSVGSGFIPCTGFYFYLGCNYILESFHPFKYCKVSHTTLNVEIKCVLS